MNAKRKPIMAGNWKMYKTVGQARQFVEALAPQLNTLPASDLPQVVICPPFTALFELANLIKQSQMPIALGAQNMAAKTEGAFTGEISPAMLTDLGVIYVIIGHSERRELFGETDASVNEKIKAALAAGLTPIVCVGESLTQREAGQTDAWVTGQVKAALQGLSADDITRLVFAYEPIWAIGTGKVCEAPEANRVIGLIRQTIGKGAVRILYGGSVKPDNIEGLMAQPEIDGGLVGGASLEPASFFQLVQGAMPVKV